MRTGIVNGSKPQGVRGDRRAKFPLEEPAG